MGGASVEQDEALNAAGPDLNLHRRNLGWDVIDTATQARQARFEGFVINRFWNIEHRDVGLVVGQHLPREPHGLAKGQRKHAGREGVEGATVAHALKAEVIADPSRHLVGRRARRLVEQKHASGDALLDGALFGALPKGGIGGGFSVEHKMGHAASSSIIATTAARTSAASSRLASSTCE